MVAGEACHHPSYLENLVQDYWCAVGYLWIEPCDIAGCHIDTAMAPIIVERSGSARVIVRKFVAGAEVSTPPCIMEEEAIGMVFHRVLDIGIGIPEGRAGWFAGLEHCRRFFKDDAPESRR